MKKIIPVIAILFCFATSYGQDTKPTKQETMDWIADVFKSCLSSNYYGVPNTNKDAIMQVKYKYVNYENGVIEFEKKWSLYYTSETVVISNYKLDLSKIIQVQIDNNQRLSLNGQALLCITDNETLKKEINNKFLFTFDYANTSPSEVNVLDYGCKDSLKKRIVNALQNLAQFNKQDLPKEKY